MTDELSWRDWLERPWALHPFLFAVLPMVRLYVGNTDCLYVSTVVRTMAVAVVCVALALLVAWPLLGVRQGSLLVTIGVAALSLRFPGWMEPFALMFFAATALVVVRARSDFALLATFANGVGAILLLTTPLANSRFLASFSADNRSLGLRPGYLEELDGALPISDDGARPDVWWILLDGHGREDILSERYGVHDGFVEWLESRGFYVAEDARSNYAQTAFSLASTLNLARVEDLVVGVGPESDQRLVVGELARDNRVTRLFRRRGYRVVAYPSEYELTEPRGVDERRAPTALLQEFDLALLGSTPWSSLSELLTGAPARLSYSLRRRSLDWTLGDLALGDRDQAPTLVLAHIVAPHPPFVFARNGLPRISRAESGLSDGSDWDATHAGTGEDYVDGYAQQVEWLHGRMRTVIDGILEHSAIPPVILIQGDHGPGADLDWESLERTDVHERLTILSAYHLPGGNARLYPSITPINSFRVVLGELFGADLPLQPDRSVYQTTSHPYDGIDVTERLGPLQGY